MSKIGRKRVFNISGPYAVGKDTILNEIQRRYDRQVHRVSTLTTRPTSGDADPSFSTVDAVEMSERTSKGHWIVTYQMDRKVLYATNIDEIRAAAAAGRICIHSIYAGPEGAGKLREIFGYELFSIALLASRGNIEDQLAVLRGRLTARNRDDAAAIAARMANQVAPLTYAMSNPRVRTANNAEQMPVFDRLIVNENLDDTVAEVDDLFRSVFGLIGQQRLSLEPDNALED